jgi:2-desacetyl-2-hydroxyethyl bacteriochlorophyllide A dehydrogenase
MKAAQYSENGDVATTLTIAEVPVRAPEANEVVVKVAYAAINPVDGKVAMGYLKGGGWAMPFPFTPGYDFAGSIVAAGTDVSGFAVGDDVFAVNWGLGKHDDDSSVSVGGAFAEFITIPAGRISKVPAGLDTKSAAALSLVATTAHQALFRELGTVAGTKILILGGAGAVGTVAVQLAKAKGAYVVTTASPRTAEYVGKLGADRIINYREDDWSEDAELKGFDAVFDTIGDKDGFARSKKILKEDGKFLSIASFDAGTDPAAHPPLKYAAFLCLANDVPVQDEIAASVASGALRIPIDSEFAFDEAGVKALFAKQDSGSSLGKNILKIA